MVAEELGTIYRKIADGNGKQYELLFSLEGMFLSVMEFDPVTDEALPITIDDVLHGLAAFDAEGNHWQNDRFQHIVGYASSAIRNLIDILHEKNLREYRISHPAQVREVDSKCMMWLAKKPGFTVKQKIASGQRMMGVYHTTSLDTAENRLFKAFMQKLDELLMAKEAACRKMGRATSGDAERFTSVVHNWLKTEEAVSIGRWGNTPPNNTLLNDKNYRKIWKAHLWLQSLPVQVQKDLENLPALKNTALFWLAAARLNMNRDVRFRQDVIFPDYETLSLMKGRDDLDGFALEGTWKKLKLSMTNNNVAISLGEQQTEYSLPSDTENLFDVHSCAEQVCTDSFPKKVFQLGQDASANSSQKRQPLHPAAAVDLASILPSFTADDGTQGRLSKKLLYQHIGEQPCSSARSKLIFTKSKQIKTFSIHSIFDGQLLESADSDENKPAVEKACADFTRTIKSELGCKKCLYITSDDADDFSPAVSAFKHCMNSAFGKTEIVPRSIAAVFSKLKEIQETFHDGDEIAVRAIHDDYDVETKIRVSLDKELAKANPETKGIFFQRLYSSRIEKKENDSTACVPKNLNRILTANDVALLSGAFSVDDFHFARQNVKRNSAPKQREILVYDCDDSSSGAIVYERLQKITPDIPLWRDFLPKLSMVDSSGKEKVLVEPNRVSIRPVVGMPVPIPINWRFSFPAGKPFYEFPLAQGEKKDKTKYFAFIKDGSFPLEHDTECSLYLTYTYGMPLPYSLEFISVSDGAEFKSVMVSWENKSHRDLRRLNFPNFCKEYNWDDMTSFEKKDGGLADFLNQWLPDQYVFIKKVYKLHISGSIDWDRVNFKKSLRFPALMVWNNGRSLQDASCPDSFRQATASILERVSDMAMDSTVPENIRDEMHFFLCCLHKDMPLSESSRLSVLEENIQKYSRFLGFAIGDVKLDWQKNLLKNTFERLADKESRRFVFQMLAVALWRVKQMVFNFASVKFAGPILDNATQELKSISGKQKLTPFDAQAVASICEVLLALFRLREKKDDTELLELLSPYYNHAVESLGNLLKSTEKALKCSQLKIRTFLKFDDNKTLFQAVSFYASGSDDSNAIKVLEADFGE